MFELKENSGSLFKNAKKTEDKHPDFTGSLKINGEVYRLAAWTKKGKKGNFLSLSVSDSDYVGKSKQSKENDDSGIF